MRRFGERFDVILSPVFPDAAPRHGEVATSPTELHDAAQPDGLAGGDGPLRDAARRAADRRAGRRAPWRDEPRCAAALALERGARRLSSAASGTVDGRLTAAEPAVTRPAGPTEAPALQTARWLARPIAFLEDCRRRYGDTFSVMFQGFKTPLVMVSRPEVIRALYAERGHNLPPGRQVTLGPLVGARSLLLLEGAEHLVAPQGDAAAVPRRPDARVRAGGARGDRARARRWPDRRQRSPSIRACRRSRSR